MWALRNELSGELYHFLTEREYFVGRKDCHITIVNDISISRKHALLKVLHTEKSVCDKSKRSTLLVSDMSKLGTRVGEEKLNNSERALKDGDVLVFGTGSMNRFRVVCNPLLVITSCLSSQQKKEIRKMVYRLGGNMMNEWCQGCSHVIMSNLSVTIKVACALISQALVVNASYLRDLLDCIDTGKCCKLPPVEDYLPTMAESQVNPGDVSFTPDPRRLMLFVGKSFIFLAKDQHERLHSIVELGGGESRLVDNIPDSLGLEKTLESLILNPNNCVVLPDANATFQHLQSISVLLKRSKLRMIPESEIGFAVLYCNTQTYCNSAAFSTSNSQNFGISQGLDESQQRSSQVTQCSDSSLNTKCATNKKGANNSRDDVSEWSPSAEDIKVIPKGDGIQPSPLNPILPEKGVISNPEIEKGSQSTEDDTLFSVSLRELKRTDDIKHKVIRDDNKQNVVIEKMEVSCKSISNQALSHVPGGFLATSCMNANLQNAEFKQEFNAEGCIVIEERNLLNKRKPLDQLSGANYTGNVKNFKMFRKCGVNGKANDIPAKKIIGKRDLVPHVNADICDAVVPTSLEYSESYNN